MRILLVVVLLLGFTLEGSAQIKHEFKTPVLRMLWKQFYPSYEIISKNDKIGLEIGAGFDLNKAGLRNPLDTINSFPNIEFDEYKSRQLYTSVALKLYINRKYNDTRISLFMGPFAEMTKITFYEQAYFVRQDLLAEGNDWYRKRYIGQREIHTGIRGGLKLVTSKNWVIEMNGMLGVVFDEFEKGEITYRPAYFQPNLAFKFGYQLGNKRQEKVENKDL